MNKAIESVSVMDDTLYFARICSDSPFVYAYSVKLKPDKPELDKDDLMTAPFDEILDLPK